MNTLMEWLHPYFYTPINILLGIRGSSELVFAVIFFIVAIKTAWEIRKYKKNGFMLKIKKLSQAAGWKFLVGFVLNINGILRTQPGYPPEITFTLLLIDIVITAWLGITIYHFAYEILMEEPDEQPNDLPPSQTTQEKPG